MVLVDKLDDLGKPAWIVLVILGFVAWWPVGLAVLAFSIGTGRFGSGRMGCWHSRNGDELQQRWHSKMGRMQEKMDRMRSRMEGRRGGDWWGTPPSSGNHAFDDYRTETLRRLEDEQREFKEFLERLRFAKDRGEFDQFMNERRDRPHEQAPPHDQDSQPQPQG